MNELFSFLFETVISYTEMLLLPLGTLKLEGNKTSLLKIKYQILFFKSHSPLSFSSSVGSSSRKWEKRRGNIFWKCQSLLISRSSIFPTLLKTVCSWFSCLGIVCKILEPEYAKYLTFCRTMNQDWMDLNSRSWPLHLRSKLKIKFLLDKHFSFYTIRKYYTLQYMIFSHIIVRKWILYNTTLWQTSDFT